MRAQLLSLVLMLPLAAVAADSGLPADLQQRLQALQHALVNAAMAGQTRVRNAAWIDSSGRLHENTRITSDLKLRNLRVLEYLTVEDHRSAAIVADARGVTPDAEACAASQLRYRREATLDTALQIATSGADQIYWTAFLEQARARFVASAGRQWLLGASQPDPGTLYARHLTGYVPDIAPYQMRLELLPAGALGIEPVRPQAGRAEQARRLLRVAGDVFTDPPRRSEPVPFVLRLAVSERASGRLLWQDAVPLFFPARDISYTSQPLPVGLLAELDNVVARWQQQLDAAFDCRPQTFNVVRAAPDGLVINGGSAAGLAVGDQLLLMNREHVPLRMLEPDSGEHLALVEVTSVGNSMAVVRQLAGPPRVARHGDWVATPF